jgi:kumamolisin
MTRRLSTSLLTLAAIVAGATLICQAATQPLLTRHTRDAVVSGQAQLVGHLPSSQTMRLEVVLALRHQPELDNFLKELYDPSSASYRHFLTVEEFTARFGASQEDYDSVVAFAKTNGLKVVGTSRNRMNVSVTGSVANVEKAFHVTMNVYQHPTENRTFFALDREPTADVSVQLWRVAGLDNYSIPRPLFRHSATKVKPPASVGSCPEESFCGSDMRAAYYGGTTLTGAGQSLGLLEYAGTDLADLTTYYKNAGQTNSVPITLVSTDGTSTSCVYPNCDDTEQTIDMTQAIGMAPGMASLVMYVGNTDAAIFNAMATAKPLNAQLSSSWYWNPADPNTDDPYFKEYAAQGQNLFDAAGDHGHWGASIWPADDAYLVSVGGTDLVTASAGGPWSSESAWSDGGGGVSPNKIPIPSWQVTTAEGCSKCSQVYRNAPDVSANSNFTFYVCADQTTCTANEYGGTSFAAPMWAGYLALANQQAVANGGPTLGFINPALYAIGLGASYDTDFHDITTGSNGYSATVGFDLATGWGSPNGSALINALVGTGGTGPAVTLTPTSLKWNKFAVGVSSAAKKVTLTNSGSAPLVISSVAVSGDFALKTVKQTKKITPCVNGTSIAASGSCIIEVTFTPTQTGVRTGDVTFTDNAPNSPQEVSLTGTGK